MFTNEGFDHTTNYLQLLVYVKNSKFALICIRSTTVYVCMVPDLLQVMKAVGEHVLHEGVLCKAKEGKCVPSGVIQTHNVPSSTLYMNCHVAILYIALPMDVSTIEARLA